MQLSSVEISKTEPTTIFIVLHRFKGALIDSKLFATKKEAESWIEANFDDPALDYKDSFYLREIVIDES